MFGGEEGAVAREEVFGPADFELPSVEQGFVLSDEGVVMLPGVLADLGYSGSALTLMYYCNRNCKDLDLSLGVDYPYRVTILDALHHH